MASQLYASEWLNTDNSLDLVDFHGQVLVVEVFQMLCPGCINHGLPQAQRISQTFARQGRLRSQYFGTVSDLGLGAQIMALVTEKEEPFKQWYNIAL